MHGDVTTPNDADLYLRGAETLIASWEAYAHGSRVSWHSTCHFRRHQVYPILNQLV
jgi:hypothetical protein